MPGCSPRELAAGSVVPAMKALQRALRSRCRRRECREVGEAVGQSGGVGGEVDGGRRQDTLGVIAAPMPSSRSRRRASDSEGSRTRQIASSRFDLPTPFSLTITSGAGKLSMTRCWTVAEVPYLDPREMCKPTRPLIDPLWRSVRCEARCGIPPRWSRQIAAYRSIFDCDFPHKPLGGRVMLTGSRPSHPVAQGHLGQARVSPEQVGMNSDQFSNWTIPPGCSRSPRPQEVPDGAVAEGGFPARRPVSGWRGTRACRSRGSRSPTRCRTTRPP